MTLSFFRSLLYIAFAIFLTAAEVEGQPTPDRYIEIKDNTARMNMDHVYRITSDSLLITGKGDYGRSNVTYLLRPLTKDEKKVVGEFIRTFPLDSLQPLYFNEYTNFQIIDADNYPRSIEVNVVWEEKEIHSRATNAWVGLYDRIFTGLNPLFPAEVRIKWDKSRFNVFY